MFVLKGDFFIKIQGCCEIRDEYVFAEWGVPIWIGFIGLPIYKVLWVV
jgi:hypothetical protein